MLNRMPRKADDETASERKKFPFLGIILVIFGVLAVWQGIRGLTDDVQKIVAPKAIINAEVVKTQEARERGLSNRSSLGSGKGMLFVFENTSKDHCFWMKEMRFSIDMVWLDDQKKVINIVSNATPESYPQTFCPDSPARYVLEIEADKASEYGIGIGTELKF